MSDQDRGNKGEHSILKESSMPDQDRGNKEEHSILNESNMSDQDRGNKGEHHHSKLGTALKIAAGAAAVTGVYKLYKNHEEKGRAEEEAKLYELEHGKLRKN